jgi:folate-binding protein YgfZ
MTAWSQFLTANGAVFDGETVVTFGDCAGELASAQERGIVCELGALSVLQVAGADAVPFLQGQLTNDVALLAPGASHLAAWCSPKGRMLANLVVARGEDGSFLLLLPSSLSATIQKRLAMFVLRSRVTIEDVSAGTVRLGAGGPAAAGAIQAALGAVPPVRRLATMPTATVLGLPGARYVAFAAPQAAPALWDRLRAGLRPAGLPAWQWLTIRAGVPVITPPTADQFVPQAANLDALDGVNFRKGCYTGQEIVARTQYLGRLKERLVMAHVDGPAPPAGTRLYSPVFDTQACGSVVNAAPAPGGGSDLLAVLQIAARDRGEVHAQTPDGPRLMLLPLPYLLPDAVPPRGRIA